MPCHARSPCLVPPVSEKLPQPQGPSADPPQGRSGVSPPPHPALLLQLLRVHHQAPGAEPLRLPRLRLPGIHAARGRVRRVRWGWGRGRLGGGTAGLGVQGGLGAGGSLCRGWGCRMGWVQGSHFARAGGAGHACAGGAGGCSARGLGAGGSLCQGWECRGVRWVQGGCCAGVWGCKGGWVQGGHCAGAGGAGGVRCQGPGPSPALSAPIVPFLSAERFRNITRSTWSTPAPQRTFTWSRGAATVSPASAAPSSPTDGQRLCLTPQPAGLAPPAHAPAHTPRTPRTSSLLLGGLGAGPQPWPTGGYLGCAQHRPGPVPWGTPAMGATQLSLGAGGEAAPPRA